jgi:hypothetical protein
MYVGYLCLPLDPYEKSIKNQIYYLPDPRYLFLCLCCATTPPRLESRYGGPGVRHIALYVTRSQKKALILAVYWDFQIHLEKVGASKCLNCRFKLYKQKRKAPSYMSN